MKLIIGGILITLGILLGAYALFYFDMSIATERGEWVLNMGLMVNKICYVLTAGFLFIAGVILMGSHGK